MAARNYAMAYDTPYNQQLLSVLRKYDMERDTNGEPNDMQHTMQGGAFLDESGSLSRKSIRYHPQLSHPLTGAMSREMGQSMMGMGVMSGGLRPPGMVSPFVQSVSPSHMVAPGTSASYPVYNAVEQRALDGGFFFPAAMALGRIAAPAIASAVIGSLASKGMDKVMGSGSAMCASCEAAQGGAKKRRGRPKKGGSILDEKFSINDIGRTGKQLFGKGAKRGRPKKGGNILDRKFSINEVKDTGRKLLGMGSILDEKFSINDIGRTGKQLFGKGAKRGRPKKMEGGLSLKGVAKGVGSLLGEVASVAKPVIKDVLIDTGKQALTSYLTGKSGSAPKKGKGVMSGGLSGVGVMKGGAMDGRKRRAEIVKKVMKEKGLKMVDASKYVKEHGLYK